MSSLVHAKWTNSFAFASSAIAGDAFLDEILDGLDVVVGRALDRLDARGVVVARNRPRSPASVVRASAENGVTSPMPFVVAKREQPAHLDQHAPLHQTVFAEDRTQRLDFGGIAAVERRQGGERRSSASRADHSREGNDCELTSFCPL